MKAAQFGEFGDPSVMVVNEVEKPVAGPGQVLVEVKAASINPFDDKLRSGMYGHKWQLPMTAGGDMAGVGHIASWTTVDVTANYLFDFDHGPLSDASVELAVTNLMNRSPPYVPNAVYPGIDFDGANANALGRFVSVQLAKRW